MSTPEQENSYDVLKTHLEHSKHNPPLITLTFNKNRVPKDIIEKILGVYPDDLYERIRMSQNDIYIMELWCYPCKITFPADGHCYCEGLKCYPCQDKECPMPK